MAAEKVDLHGCLNDSDEEFSENVAACIEENANHACTECDKVFSTYWKLYGHKRAVHIIRVSVCSFCSKEFKNKDMCRQHERLVHECLLKDEQYVCDICCKTYKSKQNLWCHKKAVHEENESFCHICGASYKNNYALKKHVKKCIIKPKKAPKHFVSGNLVGKEGFENSFYCEECDRTFL